MTMIGKMIYMCMIFSKINGQCYPTKENFLFQDLVQKEYVMIINYISSVVIKRKVETSIKIYSITISKSKNGLMWVHYKVETCQVRELIIRLFYGMEDSSYMVAMMERNGLEICTNVVLKIRNTNGKKSKVMELSL